MAMHPGLQSILLTVTATTTALSAGLLFAYSVSVNPGLGQLADEAYLSAMQSINRAIQNPVFFCIFFGPLLLLPLSSWAARNGTGSPNFVLLTIATVVYITGVIGVTVAGNVPLNEALEAFQIKSAAPEELHRQRMLFEAPWNRMHAIRTFAAVLSLVLVLLSLMKFTARPAGSLPEP